jgi:putative two-component system response regulator
MPESLHDPTAEGASPSRLDTLAPRLAPARASRIVVEPPAATMVSTPAPPRVLIVDDIPDNVRLLRLLMEPLGCEIVEANNGRQALECVEARPPDLILLDVVMPEMDGLRVCAQLKNDPATRLIPVVMITGVRGEEEKVNAIEAGADDFLNKPFSKVELLARAKALLRLKRFTDELESAEATLLTLAVAVESRDSHTGGHCERLARMGVRLGGCLGLPEASLQALRRGGYLHDIGKVAVPDAILLKPARLTEDEWAVMRRHTLVGEEICRRLRSFALVLPIIRSHHERWDGSGYPDGLTSDAIPLLARVLQMVDIYDALRTARPYKPALSASETLEQMEREAGQGWLDPQLRAAFARAHDKIVADSWPLACVDKPASNR